MRGRILVPLYSPIEWYEGKGFGTKSVSTPSCSLPSIASTRQSRYVAWVFQYLVYFISLTELQYVPNNTPFVARCRNWYIMSSCMPTPLSVVRKGNILTTGVRNWDKNFGWNSEKDLPHPVPPQLRCLMRRCKSHTVLLKFCCGRKSQPLDCRCPDWPQWIHSCSASDF